MSDDRYYVRFRGRTLGPFDENKLRGLIKRGQVTRMHELSSDGTSWQPGEAFTELFPAAANPLTSQESTSVQEAVQQNAPQAEEAEWYAHINNENKGPVTKSRLAEWVAAGAITPESLIWKTGTEDWEPASVAAPELFAQPIATTSAVTDFGGTAGAVTPQAGSKPCPFCAQTIQANALKCPHCQSMLNNFCSNCGNQCAINQAVCLNCGAATSTLQSGVVIAQPTNLASGVEYSAGFNQNTAGILALFLGGLGAHKFYHGSFAWGIIYLVFCPTLIPAILALIEGIMYFTMDKQQYDSRYNLTPSDPFKW